MFQWYFTRRITKVIQIISNIKIIFEALSSLGILITAIIAITAFKFKLGAEERKLYIDNANKVREVLGFVFSYGIIDDVNLTKIGVAFQEASLYLNKDIVEYIDKIRTLLVRLFGIQLQLNGLKVGEQRSKLCNEMEAILNKIDDYDKELIAKYRKHIVSEPVAIFQDVVNKVKDFKNKNGVKISHAE